MNPTLTAQDLENPTTELVLPDLPVAETPAEFRERTLVQADPNLVAQRDQLIQETGEQQDLPSLQGQFSRELNNLGTPDAVNQLRDVQTQLAGLNTEFNLQGARIAEGNSLAQLSREVSQNERERAIRTAGLSAQAQMLQGNIQTAQNIARDAVNFAFQDRQLDIQSRRDQLNALENQVQGQEAQLLAQRNRELDAEEAELEDVKRNVSAAVASGVASQDEIAQLTNPDVPDDQKKALAQSIIGRGSSEDRELEQAAERAGIAQGWARIDLAEREFNYKQQQDALKQELDAMVAAGELTEEQAANQNKVESALRMKDLVNQIRGHAGFNLSVGSLGSRVVNTAEFGLVGQLYNSLSGQGAGFDALYDQLTENLTLDNLDKMSGVLTDRDIQVLRSAATRLRKTTTEEEFLGVLQEMEDTFTRSIDNYGVTPEQAQFYYGATPSSMSEIDAIYGGAEGSSLLDNDTF